MYHVYNVSHSKTVAMKVFVSVVGHIKFSMRTFLNDLLRISNFIAQNEAHSKTQQTRNKSGQWTGSTWKICNLMELFLRQCIQNAVLSGHFSRTDKTVIPCANKYSLQRKISTLLPAIQDYRYILNRWMLRCWERTEFKSAFDRTGCRGAEKINLC